MKHILITLCMLCFLLITLLGSSGCSTCAVIRTEPPGALVELRGELVGKTPIEVELNDGFVEGSDYYATLRKKGFKTKRVRLRKNWSVGYIILDSLICIPTLGLGCNLIFLNGKTHQDDYFFLMERKSSRKSAPPSVPESNGPVVDIQ